MRKLFLIVGMLLMAGTSAQEKEGYDLGKNEFKLNASNLIGFKFFDVAYEVLPNEDTSLGLSFLINISPDEDFNEYRTLSLTPFVRKYFSNGYAKGFFVEGFGMFNRGNYYTFNQVTLEDVEQSYNDFALGISVGGKFVTRKGFLAEIYGGIGRNFFEVDNSPELVGRGGISIGFRF